MSNDDAYLRPHERPADVGARRGGQTLPDHQRYQRVGVSLTPAQIAHLQELLAMVGDRNVHLSDLVRLGLEGLFREVARAGGAQQAAAYLRAELHDLYLDEVAAYPGRRARGEPRRH